MTRNYGDYVIHVTDDIKTCLDSMGCQPILFVGSGMSKRYFAGPNWEELLRSLAKQCPLINKEFAYYKQSYNNLAKIGEVFADCFREWAWGDGRNKFPEDLFTEEKPPEIYIKYKTALLLDEITPSTMEHLETELASEISLLQKIHPHSIITTNYDRLLELLFPDFESIIGQRILRTDHASIGEIFKIHGCTSEPESIVLINKDYDEFMSKKKYLSAKLLTYFAEHPLLFIGYNADDPNIKSILSDIDELISTKNELIPNIYFLDWHSEISESEYPAREKIIAIDSHKSVRIKSITASSFEWVFDAFGAAPGIEKVNPKLLRALLARTYDLVRYDIPRKSVEIDYETLERAANNDGELAKIYGITVLNNPTAFNATYPYTLTGVAKRLGYNSWHNANKLIEIITEQKGVNIKSSDNKYHIAIMSGENSQTHKYSEEVVVLLEIVKNNEPFDVKV